MLERERNRENFLILIYFKQNLKPIAMGRRPSSFVVRRPLFLNISQDLLGKSIPDLIYSSRVRRRKSERYIENAFFLEKSSSLFQGIDETN